MPRRKYPWGTKKYEQQLVGFDFFQLFFVIPVFDFTANAQGAN
jgi:hypothetical protein